MISVLCECHGRLKIGDGLEAQEMIVPGQNNDGWWTASHMIAQIKIKALTVFNALHPGCVGVFLFDNSTNHGAFAADALAAGKMNLRPGGKQPKMREGWFMDGATKIIQSMITPEGQPKGMQVVLEERGLWECGLNADGARRILGLQPDFLAQRSMVEESILDAGHKCIFLPKFHCELNHIEMYWGAAKRYTRAHCDYSFAKLLPTVKEALDSVPLATIRRHARKSWRFMEIYDEGLTGSSAMAEEKRRSYAERQYRSHRRVPASVMDDLLEK